MKVLMRVLKLLLTIAICFLLILGGMFLSFRLYPQSARIAASGCNINGFVTVYCERKEDQGNIQYKIVGVKGKEIIVIFRQIPVLKFREYRL